MRIPDNVTMIYRVIFNPNFRPLFDAKNPDDRLDAGDAEYVECIHTNGGLITGIIIGALGIGSPICQADFFPSKPTILK